MQKIPDSAPRIQRLVPTVPVERVLLLVRTKPYGSEGTRPAHDRECPYYQQCQVASCCVTGSGGGCCGGFFGGTEGYVHCGWLPWQTLSGQRFVLVPEDDPEPRCQQAGWNYG
jgi:hypothetical protein